MLGYARKRTHMLSLDTNLAGELATTWGGKKEQRRQGNQSEDPARGFELGILRLAMVVVEPGPGTGGEGEQGGRKERAQSRG